MSQPNGSATASNGANGAAAAAAAAAATFHAPPSAGGFSRIQPDPELVSYPIPTSWQLLSTSQDFLLRAQEVSDLLHKDEAVRDRGNVVPHRQVQLLKDSGLCTLLGPKSAGGGGQDWQTAYHVVRIIAQGDGSLAQLLGYNYIWFWAAALVGTDEQRERIEQWLTQNKYFLGGAVNPRDADLHITKLGADGELEFNGKKTFSTGSKISDVTILEGTFAGESADAPHVFAPVLSKQDGIKYGDEWVDTLGMRGTQSGGISISKVRVAAKDALGFVDGKFEALGAYNTLNLPAIQLVFTAFYLGIAQGALKRGLEYTKVNTRGWPYTPTPAARGTDEVYIQEGYGTLQARLWASEAQFSNVVREASALLHTSPRQKVTAEQRSHLAIQVAAAKVVIADLGLEITSKVYEYMGARAVSGKYGFDVAFRDLRTHTLHDPIAHKRSEVGRFALNGQGPEPTWYT
ncbi:acyl-CoA dehydrogenase NM domain-like protein [Ceraceosorus guamensis]|uniref:Acyl-CoA dehydrogenase NM domain-like protein n=1 Tax=Ceraceosorus guamensis TaxID=1522189 RepID=A0A316VMF5_9BASI|nr:acyl-CoA dehydrogenase NM domain-like protein [Ceraceosorus guamensis]PWN38727.1 acyl-CoA dehydrogenase NM domain-like protein [Ceraceosorus guamensis]